MSEVERAPHFEVNLVESGDATRAARFAQIATALGALVTKKNKAYGDSARISGEIMRILYPNGIAVEQIQDALLVVRIIDKLSRIATDQDAFGEPPFADIAGYGILGVDLHNQIEKIIAEVSK